MTKKTKAFSYLRFSTPEQSQGDSFRRQTEAAKKYADQHDLDFQALTFEDLGVSGYRGKNLVKGALGAFLKAVDDGTIPKGSFLLVENLDRLGRRRLMNAFDTFRAILSKGINLVTLSDGRSYDADSINSLTGILGPLVDMERANAESLRKEELSRANWKQKRKTARAEGKPMTATAPTWLRLEGGKFKVIEARAATVRYIFEMALRGLGKAAICRRLNSEGVATFQTSRSKAKSWYPATIHNILTSGAVVGHFQPCRSIFDDDGRRSKVPDGDLLESYYPAVVDRDTFLRVKHGRAGISGKGQKHGIKNALAGLAVCASCGSNMVFVNRGSPGTSSKVYTYLSCDGVRRKLNDCRAPSVDYGGVLSDVIVAFDDFGDRYSSTDATSQQQELESLDAQIGELGERIERLLDAMEGSTSKGALARLEAREAELEALQARRTETAERQQVHDAENGSAAADAMMLEELRGKTAEEIEELDITWINRQLKRHLDRIEVAKGQAPVLVPR